jgi:hypothetical protein
MLNLRTKRWYNAMDSACISAEATRGGGLASDNQKPAGLEVLCSRNVNTPD